MNPSNDNFDENEGGWQRLDAIVDRVLIELYGSYGEDEAA